MNEEYKRREAAFAYASAKSRRMRVNRKKLARFAALLACIVAGIALAVYFSDSSVPAAAAVSEESGAPSAGTSPLAGKLVVLDAGHGGFDIGATGVMGTHEDELNLKVAFLLKAQLEDGGARVIMTREDSGAIADSKDEDMQKRRNIIQDSASDIVVSIHMNIAEAREVSGPVVLFMPGSVRGEMLAKAIQRSMIQELNPVSQNSARSEDLYILKSGSQPCVIVECGFLSNAAEEALLVSEGYQRRIARAVAGGVSDYFEQLQE